MNNLHTVCDNIFLSKEHPVDGLPTDEIDNRQCNRDSQTAGHASRIASFVREPCVCSVLISMLPITFSWIFPIPDSHNALLHS